MSYSKPIILMASQTLQAGAQSGVNALSLMNPSGEPMEVLQVNFMINQSSTARISANAIGAKLMLDDVALTNGYVPLGLFSPARQVFTEEPNATAGQDNYNWYHWAFSRPLYIEPGQTIVPMFTHRNLIKQDVNVQVAYIARTFVGNKPKELPVPFASFYASKVFTASSASADSDASKETDLQNATGTDMIVNRFVGRIVCFNNSAAYYTEQEDTNTGDFGRSGLTLRMRDSNGNQVIRDYTPFRLAFNASTRSWETYAKLRPDGFYIANLAKAATAYGTNTFAQALIGMVGYRMVRI